MLVGWFPFAILSSSFGWCVGFDRFVFGDRCADATDLPANDIACLLLFTGSLPDSGFAPLHVDVNYRLQGTVAYCCMLGAFVLYVRIVVPWKRVLAGWLLMAVLFVLAGPVATLFVAGVVVREMLLREKGWQGCLALPFGIVLMLWWSYRFFWQPEYRMIVLPDFYYEPLLKANKLYWAWLAFLSGLLMACFPIGKGRGVLDRTAWWWTTVQLLPLVAFLGWMKKKRLYLVEKHGVVLLCAGRTMG